MSEMINKLQKIFKKQFVRSVFVVASGTAFAQVLMIVFSPLITRIYGPDVFGVLGVFTSIANIIIPISALTLPIAIVLPKEDKEGESIAYLSVKATAYLAMILLILVLIAGNNLLHLLNAESIGKFIYLLPLVVIFSGLTQISQQRLYRVKNFNVGAKVQVVKTLVMNVVQVAIGIIIPHSIVLIVTTILGYGLQAVILLRSLPMKFKWIINKNLFKLTTEEKSLLKKYRDFPLYRMPQIFINSFSNSLPIMLLSVYFGPASVGFYTIGKKVLGLPSQLIGQAIGDVFYPHASSVANNKQRITHLLIKSTVSLAFIGILPFGIVVIFGPQLFSFVFGQEWNLAGVYAQWLSLWSFFVFINRPSVRVLPIINAQQFFLKFEIFGTIIKSVSIMLGGMFFKSDLLAIAFFSITNVILNILLIIYTIHKTKVYDNYNCLL
jgi:O-antigen/teichoic acid export membrane protein